MSLSDDYLEPDFELLFWQYDTRRRGGGPYRLNDGTRVPQNDRDAFKNTLRNWEYLHKLEELRRQVAESSEFTSSKIRKILGELERLNRKTKEEVG